MPERIKPLSDSIDNIKPVSGGICRYGFAFPLITGKTRCKTPFPDPTKDLQTQSFCQSFKGFR
ncbi:Uncharacterised protein [Neisseria gonorrhoeae]|uniref:Uncharacterized protein n=1 Tax=Neisseria gonorrhoeae TaxID=485 RepID=A0A378VYJ2_NEIGO|nr:Uncharacterised protein [Neisseria gonorrhoeae]